MRSATKRAFSVSKTPERHWSAIRELIGHKLKRYYQENTTEELPPRLLALIKKMDEEQPEHSGPQVQAVIRETKV